MFPCGDDVISHHRRVLLSRACAYIQPRRANLYRNDLNEQQYPGRKTPKTAKLPFRTYTYTALSWVQRVTSIATAPTKKDCFRDVTGFRRLHTYYHNIQ